MDSLPSTIIIVSVIYRRVCKRELIWSAPMTYAEEIDQVRGSQSGHWSFVGYWLSQRTKVSKPLLLK